jgi:hypothetical protein
MNPHDDFRDIVKLAAINEEIRRAALTEKELETFMKLIGPGAAEIEKDVKDAHWIYGADDGADYCEECALERINNIDKTDPDRELELDGGWRTEHDSLPTCDACGCQLDGCLTYYGADCEIEHFKENGFDPQSAYDCFAMSEVLNTFNLRHAPIATNLKKYPTEDSIRFIELSNLIRKTLETSASRPREEPRVL